ncbi:MAG: Asp-tRNA(Asn)/Glu-tRNA(Gln) amidotransferase subunit GatA [Chloroflexi bacterium]|nr:Asp-tRNA(Asn)/Glu-tRNA(Gln) amidotransferase subunit GatA [Chloroflexota bacterium]
MATPLPTLTECRQMLDTGKTSSLELTTQALECIAELDSTIGAFLTIIRDQALAAARAADARLVAGERTPVLGIPMALKDVLITKGITTTAGSKMLMNYVPPFNSTVAERLERAGAVLLGKLNCDEFAMGSSNENSAFKPVHNPWDHTRVPGGSSGGSAAAVAAGEAVFTLGSDTGGSIRQPASFCGVVGMKPTYGRVSRFGLIAFASSLDQVGPLTRTCADAARVMSVIAGGDPRDSTSSSREVPDYVGALKSTHLDGIRVGIPKEFFVSGMEPGVQAAIQDALCELERLGATLHDVSLPYAPYALPAYYIIAPAEASANLARFDGVKYGYRAAEGDAMWDVYAATRGQGFGSEVKRRIMLGTYALSAGYYDAYYLQAQKVRTLIRKDYEDALQTVDVLAAPTAPTTAFRLGEKSGDPVAMYFSDVCTIPLNLAGLPGLVVPCALVDHLPVGLQLMGRAWGEAELLRIGHALEQSSGAIGLPGRQIQRG